MEIFLEISLITAILTLISYLMKTLKQPFIVGYILTGILVGPFGLNILKSTHSIDFFSQMGITILLYIVGLNLNPKVLNEVGSTSLKTGLGQVIFTTLIGLFLCTTLGIALIPSLYIAIAMTFSSTIIVLKLLTDRGDLNTLYGKISMGLLLIQDLVASFLLISITNSSSLELLIIKGIFLILLFYILSKFILPKVLHHFAENQEFLFIFSVAYGLSVASLFTILGFSKEIGALVAGVSLSATVYASEISSKLKPLRDFFIPLFFILLGSQMNLSNFSTIVIPALILSLYVLIGNPLIVFILLNLQGFKTKTAFKAGLTMAQISEFSLILASLGYSLKHLSTIHLSLITLIGLITISGSSYLILYSDKIYLFFEKFLKHFELNKHPKEKKLVPFIVPEVILFGYDKSGSEFVKAVKDLNKNYLIVDYNPEAITRLKAKDLPYQYGDAEDVEFLDDIGLSQTKLVISTIPTIDTNKFLVQYLANINPKAISVVISHHIKDTLELYKLGASYVIVPIYFGSRYLSHILSKHGLDHQGFADEKSRHLQDLQTKI